MRYFNVSSSQFQSESNRKQLAGRETVGLQDDQVSSTVARLVNLFQRMREMHSTLTTINRANDLTDFIPIVGKLTKLMPDRYAEQFFDKLYDYEYKEFRTEGPVLMEYMDIYGIE